MLALRSCRAPFNVADARISIQALGCPCPFYNAEPSALATIMTTRTTSHAQKASMALHPACRACAGPFSSFSHISDICPPTIPHTSHSRPPKPLLTMGSTRGKRVPGKKKPKSIKAKVTSKMSSKRRLSRMGKEMKKGQKGIVANYMTRSQVLRRLQITLRDFRCVGVSCIRLGVDLV